MKLALKSVLESRGNHDLGLVHTSPDKKCMSVMSEGGGGGGGKTGNTLVWFPFLSSSSYHICLPSLPLCQLSLLSFFFSYLPHSPFLYIQFPYLTFCYSLLSVLFPPSLTTPLILSPALSPPPQHACKWQVRYQSKWKSQ